MNIAIIIKLSLKIYRGKFERIQKDFASYFVNEYVVADFSTCVHFNQCSVSSSIQFLPYLLIAFISNSVCAIVCLTESGDLSSNTGVEISPGAMGASWHVHLCIDK